MDKRHIKHTSAEKVALMELAARLNNVAAACKTLGFSRDSYYRIKRAYQHGGVESLGRRKKQRTHAGTQSSGENKNRRLEERLEFESLISELSAKFINLPVDLIDRKIEEGQEKVCKAIGLHRSVFLEISLATRLLTVTHAWFSHGVSRQYPREVIDEFTYFNTILSEGRIIIISDIDELPDEKSDIKKYFRELGVSSLVAVPLRVGKNLIGAISWESYGIKRKWPKALVERLRLISEVFANALSRKRSEEALCKSIAEIKELKDQLQAENLYLINEIKLEHSHHQIVGESPSIRKMLNQVEKVAGTGSTVLILGETGTGKELLANAIHDLSPRRDRHMVKVNCSALPATLIESELFGHEKGAYTGALVRKPGRFELANRSTILLDEVGDLPLELQPKLLRVLQEGQFERVGGAETISVDVRVVAATNRNLVSAVRQGKFRSDLFYRLNVFPITVPPLRDRAEDIPMLVRAFVQQFSVIMGKAIDTIPARSMEALKRYSWPGNIRELRNLVERAMIFSRGNVIEIQVPKSADLQAPDICLMDDVQRNHILQILKKTGWQISGDKGAAGLLGMNPSTLRARMRRLGISPNRRQSSGDI